jgi:hypothetical protein
MVHTIMNKLGFTAYGKVGTDAVRMSIARLDDGAIVWVAEDGSNAVLSVHPTRFVTSGHVANVAAHSGIAFNMAAMPWEAVATGHEWKAPVTLRQLSTRKSFTAWSLERYAAIRDGLMASYELIELDSIAA